MEGGRVGQHKDRILGGGGQGQLCKANNSSHSLWIGCAEIQTSFHFISFHFIKKATKIWKNGLRGSLKRSARAVRAHCSYLGVWPY